MVLLRMLSKNFEMKLKTVFFKKVIRNIFSELKSFLAKTNIHDIMLKIFYVFSEKKKFYNSNADFFLLLLLLRKVSKNQKIHIQKFQ